MKPYGIASSIISSLNVIWSYLDALDDANIVRSVVRVAGTVRAEQFMQFSRRIFCAVADVDVF